MKPRWIVWLVLVACFLGGGPGVASAQTGWMQQGVRVWYFGGAGDNVGTLANATEAYLFESVAPLGGTATLVCHKAATNWTLPQPVQRLNVSLTDQGPFWIPPAMLQTIQPWVDHWYDPQQVITFVERKVYTYQTFQSVLPPSPPSSLGPHLLPVKALFDLKGDGQRQLVKLSYEIPYVNSGNAWFDAETGLLLYRGDIAGYTRAFFMLAEINYDFATRTAFAEDNGPHAGYLSDLNEASASGIVSINSLVETRYGATIETRVKASFYPPWAQGDENYCFFDSVWDPKVTRMLPTQAPHYPPDQWNPAGQYLWWWLPQTATGIQGATAADAPSQTVTQARVAGTLSNAAAALTAINVLGVSMTKTSDLPLTYDAAQTSTSFHFTRLTFDSSGYLTEFWSKNPTVGPTFSPGHRDPHHIVNGLDYFTTTMRRRMRRGTDFDGDSKSDATVFRPSTGVWFELRSATSAGHGVAWGLNGDKPVSGDYDGDGKTDVAVFRPASGTWFILQSATGTGRGVTWGLPTDIPVPADYDGDGKTDVAVWRPSQGVWYIIRSSTNSAVAISWGMEGDTPVPGDFDGDGKADPTVFRNASGTWYQLRSTTGIGFGVRWGQNGDTPLAGDYDGDGKADPTVFRESAGTWYELRSATGVGFGVTWGTVNDVPVVGDYDGDGKADPTVFRASSGMWYELRSGSGTGWGIVWGVTGDVPQ